MQHEMLEDACGVKLGTDGPRAHPPRDAGHPPQVRNSFYTARDIFIANLGRDGEGLALPEFPGDFRDDPLGIAEF